MRMQLRVVETARGLAEHCHRQALALGVEPVPVGADAGGGPVLFDTAHHRPDRDVMTLRQSLIT